jgi:hypothetical protein
MEEIVEEIHLILLLMVPPNITKMEELEEQILEEEEEVELGIPQQEVLVEAV